MAKRYHLSARDRDLLGRMLKKSSGAGRGELPLPKRRRGDFGGGSGGTFAGIRCRAYSSGSAATGWSDADLGAIDVEDLDSDGVPTSAPFTISNAAWNTIAAGTPGIRTEGIPSIFIPLGCSTGPLT